MYVVDVSFFFGIDIYDSLRERLELIAQSTPRERLDTPTVQAAMNGKRAAELLHDVTQTIN